MSRLRSIFSSVTGLAALGLILAALGLTALLLYMLTERVQGIAEAFRPSVESRVVLAGTIEDLRTEGKLVVLTADVMVESESSTAKRIFFDLLDAGTTTVRVRAPGRVQYVVPLRDVSRDDFAFDPQTRRLVLTLPSPRLDTTIVEVSTDPAEIEVNREIGWLRLNAFSGRFNEERARRLLRDAAIETGRSGEWLNKAQSSARDELRNVMGALVAALQDDVELIIAFHGDEQPTVESPDALPRPR